MKNLLKVLIAVMLVVTCAFTYVACDNNSETPNGDSGTQDPTNKPGGNTTKPNPDQQPPDDDDDDSEFMEDAWQITFHYSYTAQIVNENDRTENKQADVKVDVIYIPYDEADAGWTDKYIAKKDALTYHGYKFEAWYPAWNDSTQTGWNTNVKPQMPVGDPYDFTTEPITGDIHLYAYKGVTAGDDVKWNVEFNYETDAAILPEVPDNSVTVKFVNIGWTDDVGAKAGNAVDNVTLSAVAVDKTVGWDSAALALVDAIRYDGYHLTWYAEWDETTMNPVGDPYDFKTAPTDDITLYGYLGNRDEEYESTAKTLVSGILSLNGSGDMYNFNDANTIDVPWYEYRESITKVVMADGITNVGKNAFANFTLLKEIDFSDDIKIIGENAFYKCTSTALKSIRFPSSVVEIGIQAFLNSGVRDIVLNNGLLYIKNSAFSGAKSLQSVVVPTTLKSIDAGAFKGADKISKVYYEGISKDAFFAHVTAIGADNETLKDFASFYSYSENEPQSEGLFWHYYPVDGVKYPAQYTFALQYTDQSSKIPFYTDYVPVSPKFVQDKDEDGNLLVDTNGNPVMVQEFDPETGVPVFEGKITADNNANYIAILSGDKIINKDNVTVCDRGYGYVRIDVANVSDFKVDAIITGDREMKCIRGDYTSTANQGILGGGITWTYQSGVITISPSKNENDSNETWSFYKATDATELWTKSTLDVSKITTVVIENGVKGIGDYVFSGIGMKEIVIPDSVEYISSKAFLDCASLLYIYYDNYDVPEKITVGGSRSAKIYKRVNDAVDNDGNFWLKNQAEQRIAWSLSNGKLFVGGDDVMMDFASAEDAPWYGAKSRITSVEIANNITSLGSYLISSYSNVTGLVLPRGLRIIPETAFANTGILNDTVNYNSGLLVVDGHLLKVDPSRRNTTLFVIPVNVAGYEKGEVVKKSSVINIADGAFSRCDKIETVHFSTTIQYINSNAFRGSNFKRILIGVDRDTWANVAMHVDFTRIQMFYKNDFVSDTHKPKPNTCNHVFDDSAWEVVKEATCLEKGILQNTCIFKCKLYNSVETKDIGINENAHTLVEVKIPATCLKGEQTVKVCTNSYVNNDSEFKCSYEEVVSETANTKLEHEYGNVVADQFMVPGTEDDPEYYTSCINGCGQAHESNTFKPEADNNTEPEGN